MLKQRTSTNSEYTGVRKKIRINIELSYKFNLNYGLFSFICIFQCTASCEFHLNSKFEKYLHLTINIYGESEHVYT